MGINRLLIANRGEIAIRIARAAAELGIRSVAAHSQDDVRSLHVRRADGAVALPESGPRAYLNVPRIIAAAQSAGCDALHPGYGFLSESAAFAAACREAGLIFVGPRTDVLQLFGGKTQARALAQRLNVPLIAGTFEATTLDQALIFMRSRAPGTQMVIKASAGGGGCGMRVVSNESELPEAYTRCRSEAAAAFGVSDVYIEEYFPQARRIEVQIIGDGRTVSHLRERECSLQRRHQKLVEIAPSPTLSERARVRVIDAAVGMAREVRFDNAGTFEFLVDSRGGEDARFADSLLAKVVAHAQGGIADAAHRAYRALCEFRIEGVATNKEFVQNLLRHPAFLTGDVDTRFIENHVSELIGASAGHPRLYLEPTAEQTALAGARVDTSDPLAVLRHGKERSGTAGASREAWDAERSLCAPLQGTIVSIDVREGELVRKERQLLVMESMKMEHVIAATHSGWVQSIAVAIGDAVFEGAPLIAMEAADVEHGGGADEQRVDLDPVRSDLQEVVERHARTLDAAVRLPWRAVARPGSAPRARTSKHCAIRRHSSSTVRSCWPRSGRDARSMN